MTIRLTLRRVATALCVLLLGGMLFAWSGLFNVAATGGHWAATDWFLHWVMRNSIRTYAMTSVGTPPDLDDRALLARGAGHYAVGCAACHGAPGEPQNPVIQQSTPFPPDFSKGVAPWSDGELFRIVQHGVRFTGMPGWIVPSRSDEIWSVVAFLRAMPELSPEAYRVLAHGKEAAHRPQGEQAGMDALAMPNGGALSGCASCHGRDGMGRDGDAFPIIAGQSEAYLLATLKDFASGARQSGIMQPAASRVSEQQLRDLAAHYASQPRPARPAAQAASVATEEGERIARNGIPAQQVPACLSCHGADGVARNPALPRLEGQHASYLAAQLHAWRQGARGGRSGAVMEAVANRLTPAQIEAVSKWFAQGYNP